jgi:hypothetical protein
MNLVSYRFTSTECSFPRRGAPLLGSRSQELRTQRRPGPSRERGRGLVKTLGSHSAWSRARLATSEELALAASIAPARALEPRSLLKIPSQQKSELRKPRATGCDGPTRAPSRTSSCRAIEAASLRMNSSVTTTANPARTLVVVTLRLFTAKGSIWNIAEPVPLDAAPNDPGDRRWQDGIAAHASAVGSKTS